MVGDKEKIEELFATWLAQNAPSAHLSELCFCYSEIEAYCLKIKVLRKPLFETIDLDIIKRVQKTVTESRIFQLSHKKQMRKIVTAAQYYKAFVKSLVAQETNTTELSISQTMGDISSDGKPCEVTQRKEIALSENKKEDNVLIIDFCHINSFAYTKPVSFSYFGDEQTGISNWTQLYVKVLVCLSEDYPDEFLRMYNTNISGGRRIDFGSQKASDKMNAPKEVSDNFYVETNLSATDIVMKIRLLLDRCNVDYENLEIRYIKIESMQCTEPSLVENASKRAASATKNTMSAMVTIDTGNYKAVFRNWLLHDQYMAERSAQSYSSAITNCEQLASRLGLKEIRLYGADRAEAQRVVDQLRQTTEYWEVNASQHNRYNAAITKYLLYLQSSDRQETTACVASKNKEPEQQGTDFDRFFEDEKYDLLYKELKKKGITTLEELNEVNLWSFMNLHQLYSIQQRLAISTELTAKLRNAEKENDEQNTSVYEIHYNGGVYKGTSPSKAFVAFLTAVSTRYPLKFRTLLNVYNPESQKIVVSQYDYGNTKLRLMNPEAYIDSDLSLEQVQQDIAWIIKRCDVVPQDYSVEEKTKSVEMPQRKPTDRLTKDLQKVAETPATSISSVLRQEAEDYLLQCDLTGATYEELQNKLHYTMVGTKEIVAQSPHIIEMNRKLYHEEALVDFEEGADTLEAILDKLLKKNDGVATAKHLYEYACSEMAMFFNDNGIIGQQSVYDLARHLFEKLKYHGKHYVFKSNMYISLPEYSADSVIDIVSKYAREKGATVTYDELVRYLTGLGSNTGNLRGLMRIDKEPVFLIYAENEYLLAELMHIDTDFLESIHCALRRLFEDTDGHIIPRNISESWYNLLPTLPACLPWTPMLLQQLIRFYPNELEARTIIAMESQNSNTLHAMFVEKDSWIQDFRDVVAVFLHNEMPSRYEFEAEELRGILVDAGMISGSQLIYNMPNALGGDPRFLWDSDGNHVKVMI